MAPSRIRRRWTRRAIAILIVINTALWASFVLAGRHSPGTGKSRGSSVQSREFR